jgi:ribonuclease inhibitor
MIVELDGAEIRTEADFHEMLAARLDMGYSYGENIPALEDRLVWDVERPVELIWHDAAVSRQQLGPDLFDKIVEILEMARANDEQFGRKDRFVYELR